MADIEQILDELDEELDLVQLIDLGESPIYGLATDGARVATIWDTLYEQREETGCWPLIFGTERDVEAHREAAGLRRTDISRLEARAAAAYRHLDSMPLNDAISEARSAELSDVGVPDDASEHLGDTHDPELKELRPDAGALALEVPVNLATGSAYEEVFVGLCPITTSWRCPLLLNFGGWNECPPPEAHAAQLARWEAEWGAELISLSDTTMELRVARTPDSWKAAFDLASELADYCPELVSRGSWNLRTLAEYLCDEKLWRCWWS